MTVLGGACDTHLHFYDARFPVAPEAVVRPPDAGVEGYRSVQQRLGLDRLVVVQPTTYGLDNTCQLEAMRSFGDSARGVMVVDADTPGAELARLTELGVCGARFHMLPGGAVGWDAMAAVADNVKQFGWHIQLQLNGRELVDRLAELQRLPVSLVIDHVGRFMPPVGADDLRFAALLKLVDGGAHVKLSAPYESSVDGPSSYDDVTTLVDVLVAHAPDRLLWATNWPHPGQAEPPSLDDLAALRDRWLPTEMIQRQILVDNPAALYGF